MGRRSERVPVVARGHPKGIFEAFGKILGGAEADLVGYLGDGKAGGEQHAATFFQTDGAHVGGEGLEGGVSLEISVKVGTAHAHVGSEPFAVVGLVVDVELDLCGQAFHEELGFLGCDVVHG